VGNGLSGGVVEEKEDQGLVERDRELLLSLFRRIGFRKTDLAKRGEEQKKQTEVKEARKTQVPRLFCQINFFPLCWVR